MRGVLLAILLPLVASSAYAKPKFFHKYLHKTWERPTGWCFSPKIRKMPKWFGLHVCVPRRWGAADICILEKVKVNKRIYFMVGYKGTYSTLRYEFLKKKEYFAHGPYVYFNWKL